MPFVPEADEEHECFDALKNREEAANKKATKTAKEEIVAWELFGAVPLSLGAVPPRRSATPVQCRPGAVPPRRSAAWRRG